MAVGMRKWMALGATLAMLLAAGYGTTAAPCYEAYLMSGINEQQMSFEEFRKSYSDSVCVTSGEGGAALVG